MSVENTHYGACTIENMLKDCHSIFFIGIGGISMSALSRLSLHAGYRTGGSDRTQTPLTDELERQGITLYIGHDASHIQSYDAVIYTVAISPDNPEYAEAKRQNKPLISRADYLGYLMTRFKTRIGIAGMHGKSTATAMCADILLAAADPTVLCGAELPSLGHTPCRIGTSREHFLFEACEYMDSFLDFNPTLAVILNIGLDHVDYFHSMEQIRSSFLHFAERTGEDGQVLYNADDAETQTVMQNFQGKKYTFGLQAPADFTAKNILRKQGVTSFDLYRGDTLLTPVTMRSTGIHNLYNALAASAVATLCKIPPSAVSAGLAAFRGAHRRMEYKGCLPSGAAVYEDYAHHPDEIKATLAGARELGFSRVLCAYQPHTFSRTAGLLDAFSVAFDDSDLIFLADVYAAREQNVYGVTSKTLADRIGKKAHYCGGFSQTAKAILANAKQNDLVLVMGAGDVCHILELLPLTR